MSADPKWSADCHASGAVPYYATAVKADGMLRFCGHCLIAPRLDQPTHLDALTQQGWDVYPVKRHRSNGSGTESTPQHFALDF